jgi:hypothetical protein
MMMFGAETQQSLIPQSLPIPLVMHPAKILENYELRARDGSIGHVKDFYFDDQKWHVRYAIVDTGLWLTGRKVLISTAARTRSESEPGYFSVELTKEQVRNSPDIDTTRPVSRQHEEQLHSYYAWPNYWGGPYVGGGVSAPIAGPAAPTASAVHASRAPLEGRAGETLEGRGASRGAWREKGDDPHLRSVNAVRGYHIEATDGSIGHVADFVIDEATWAVRYLLIDTRNWLPGKKVIVSPSQIRDVSWLESSVFVDLTREAIKSGPEFDESRPLTADYTDRLDAHYRGWPRPR